MNSNLRLFFRLLIIQLAVLLTITSVVVLLVWLFDETEILFTPQTMIAAVTMLAATVLSTVILLSGSRRILGVFITALRQVRAGKFDSSVPDPSRLLLTDLAHSIDDVAHLVEKQSTQLSADQERLRNVLNSMVEGVLAVDPQQRIVLWNHSATKMFNIPEHAAASRPMWEMVRNHRLQQWVESVLQDAKPRSGDIEFNDPVQRIFNINVVSLPMSPRPGAVIVVSDVSGIRRLERIRQEFVANASHELKTPLASIKACAETLMDGAIDEPEFRTRFLQSINDQAERLDLIVKDMLALARIESEAIIREPRPIELAPIVESCINRYRQAAEKKQLTLIIQDPPNPIQVLADDEALEQILENLVDNAIKYTNPGGVVTIRWREADVYGLIEVQDTGIGIPQNQLPRIFERFYRVDRHRSRDIGGTGLGLSIVKNLVQALGGSISVSSRLHHGTTFAIRLALTSSRMHMQVLVPSSNPSSHP